MLFGGSLIRPVRRPRTWTRPLLCIALALLGCCAQAALAAPSASAKASTASVLRVGREAALVPRAFLRREPERLRE